MRFLLGFALTWFMGTSVLGTVFASVNPCFYGKLLPGVDPDAPLMAWLGEVNQSHTIFALTAMNELWKNYETGTGLINGISAMPSMHVGTSIHLGWHYAIDGYWGAVVVLVCWWLAGKIVAWDRNLRGLAMAA